MDGKGACRDNASVELLVVQRKYEEIYLNAYVSASDVSRLLTKYFRFYNESRKHETLMATPDQINS